VGQVWVCIFGGELAVLQSPTFDGQSLDPFTLNDDGLCPAEVGVIERHCSPSGSMAQAGGVDPLDPKCD